MKCNVANCNRDARSGGMCNRHYEHNRLYGEPTTAKVLTPAGEPATRTDGYRRIRVGGVRVLEHIAIAERALGRPLPVGAVVHHADENRSNNEPTNLVICPDGAYHRLLHARMQAQAACGHPAWRKCTFCKVYDDTANLAPTPSGAWKHLACAKQYMRARYLKLNPNSASKAITGELA